MAFAVILFAHEKRKTRFSLTGGFSKLLIFASLGEPIALPGPLAGFHGAAWQQREEKGRGSEGKRGSEGEKGVVLY